MNTTGCNERTLMDYCPDIKVVDCTLRDGGLVNNFSFSDEFVKDLYQANIKAGVDYMEFGYKASKELFDVNAFGKWKFCNEEDIRAIVGENNSPLKIAVMADVGRCDYEKDILPKEESVIDMIRVATYIHQIPTAIKMIEDFKQQGYEVCVNIMAVSKVNSDDLAAGLQLLSRSSVDVIYLVDSFGSFYPEQITKLAQQYVDIANASGKIVGMHAHNNQQLAFANTIEACRNGVCLLDATVNGMGRGAGNCYSESLLSFLKNPKYDEVPIIRFIEKHMLKLKAEGVVWGYDLPYLITGILNSHPSIAINFLKENRTDYTSFLHEVMDMH
ncbi:MAG: aldolase catalytic domain-containing protein [Lachnospiraceae bacterium]|nr:aldolase catalytic domain-containing protein [Lachnospiraceae bacterium]